MKTERKVRSYKRRTKNGKVITVKGHTRSISTSEMDKLKAGAYYNMIKYYKSREKGKLSDDFTPPKRFNYGGTSYFPVGNVKYHTERNGKDTYKVATIKATSKKGHSITLYKYDKKGQKDYGARKWDVDVTA